MLYLFRRNSYCFGMPPTSSKCIFYVEFLAKMFATFWSSFLNSHVHPPPKKSYMTSTVSAVCVIDWRHGGCLTVFRMLTCSHSHALLMRVCGSGVALASFGGSHVMHFVVDRWGFCQRSLARLCTLATFHDCTIALEHGWANVGAQGVGWGVGGGGKFDFSYGQMGQVIRGRDKNNHLKKTCLSNMLYRVYWTVSCPLGR